MKILMQYDPSFGNFSGCDPDALVKALFYGIDVRDERPDIILWETHRFLQQESETNQYAPWVSFRERSIDIMKRVIEETHKRGIKAYWHHRFSEVEPGSPSLSGRILNPIKQEHPDWVIKTWYEQGLWNLASPELQDFKISYIRKIADQYDFDGLCIDYLRHLPCLPPGSQWEHRDCVTCFMEKLRIALPAGMKLGAKLPENEASCRIDGFDVEEWAEKSIVDFLVAGSRSISSDVAWYKTATAGTGVEVYPCWDTWHSSDACHWREDDFYRGVFANWISEGADGIVGFNYVSAPAEVLKPLLPAEEQPWETRDYTDFFRQIQTSTSNTLSRTYAAERRGGYPYATGAGGTNCFAPLPADVGSGTAVEIPLRIYDNRPNVTVRILISGSHDAGIFDIMLNGTPLTIENSDPSFIDRQIRYPEPQAPSGAGYCFTDFPSPLLMLRIPVSPDMLRYGENRFTVKSRKTGRIQVERLELTISGNG